VEDNVAAGHRDAAYFFFTSGLVEDGLGRRGFPTAHLPERLRANNIPSPKDRQPPDRMTVNYLPILSCKGNTAFASGQGMVIRFHTPPVSGSVVDDCTIWNTSTGVRILYSDNIRLRNLRLFGSGKSAQVGVYQGSEAIGGTVYENLRVEGWATGLAVSDIVAKSQVIDGGYYDNDVNIALALAYTHEGAGRVDEIKGSIRFGPKSKRDVSMRVNYEAFYTRDPNLLFFPNAVRIDTPTYRHKQIYYADQGADYVPLKAVSVGKFRPAATGHVPVELIGKTNAELWEKYGLAIGGTAAPADAKIEPKIDGLVGDRSTVRPGLTLHNVYSAKLEGYRPNCSVPGQTKKPTSGFATINLERGWNLVTHTIDNQVQSFLVFGGADRPVGQEKSYPKGDKPGEKAPTKNNTRRGDGQPSK
jgi:hypothetical protein